jgi:hypothetical protein
VVVEVRREVAIDGVDIALVEHRSRVAPDQLLVLFHSVAYHNEGTFFITTFFDANGTAVRELDRGAYFLESYSANGKTISSKSPAMIHLDPATNIIVGTGNQRHFIVPGLGIILAQAGRSP